MPRKTIASLEKKIADMEHLGDGLVRELDAVRDQRDSYIREIERLTTEPANTFLSYVPTGFADVDAVHVVTRTIDSLQDPVKRKAVAAWVYARFHAADEED